MRAFQSRVTLQNLSTTLLTIIKAAFGEIEYLTPTDIPIPPGLVFEISLRNLSEVKMVVVNSVVLSFDHLILTWLVFGERISI